MKKNSPSQSLPELDLLDEGTALDWMHKNSTNIALGFAALVALFVLGYWLLSRSTTKYEAEYFASENAMVKLEEGGDTKPSLEKLTSILSANPDLQSKYDGRVAETLILQNNVPAALPFANRDLERVKVDQLPLYSDYAQGSLLIGQNSFEEALKLAQTTQTKMEEEDKRSRDENTPRTFGDALYAFNTVRIAMLQQKNGQKAEAGKTWDKLTQETLSANSLIQDKRVVEGVIAHFNDSGVSLSSYIDAQKVR